MWTKHGLIYLSSKAQLPVVEKLHDRWRIFYTSRNEKNQNVGNYLDVEIGSPYIITMSTYINKFHIYIFYQLFTQSE